MPYGFTQNDWEKLGIEQREAIRIRAGGMGGEEDPLAWESAEVRPTLKLTHKELAPEQPEAEKPTVPGPLGRMASGMMPQIFTTPERQAEVAHEEGRLEAQVAAARQEEAAQAPGAGAFEPPAAAPPTGRGLGLPKTQIPELAELEKRLGGVERAWGKAQKRIEKAGVEKRAAIGEWAKTEQEKLRAEADVLGEAALISRDLEAQRIESEEYRQTYVNQELGKVRDAVDQMKASKIDPYRFYKHPDGSADYPKSIAAAVAIGLGALGAALPRQYGGTGGPNVALQIIDKAIDRDIQAQRDDIANQRAGVGIQMNLLSQMRGQFADERQAENAARVVMLETYKIKLQEAAARSGSEQVKAKAEMMIAEADQKEAVLLGDMEVKASSDAFRGEQVMLGAEWKQADALFRQEAMRIKAMMKKTGKQLPANAVAKMADFRGAAKMVQHVKKAWNESMKGNWAAGLTQYAPWATDAKSFDDMIRIAAQIIGKKFEGRMTDEDYARFLRMMPQAGDSTKRAMYKLNTMATFLGAMESETVRTYQETGFDVSGFLGTAGRGKPTAGFQEL